MLTYPGVYVEEPSGGVPTIRGVGTSITAFVGSAPTGPTDQPIAITSFAEFEQIFGGLWIESSLGFSIRDLFLNGGSQAIIVRVNPSGSGNLVEADFIGAGKESANQGLFALKKVALFNLMCVPPYNPHGNADRKMIAAAASFCEDHRAFLLIDPLSEWTSADQAKVGIADLGTTSKNAAIFFPRLRIANPLRNNQLEVMAPIAQGPYGESSDSVECVEVGLRPSIGRGTEIADRLAAKGYHGP